MDTAAAVEMLREDPANAELIADAYLDRDPSVAAERFAASAEFYELLRLTGDVTGRAVLDLGTGRAAAASAFSKVGARVVGVDPDLSEALGLGGARRSGGTVSLAAGVGERLPFRDECFDVVYCRQVLHHTHDLDMALHECARVLSRGGVLLATREHVVDDDAQLQAFLASHPVHQLAGGEHAHPLSRYVTAIEAAGLTVRRQIGPWDSIINAFPTVRSAEDLPHAPAHVLGRRFGAVGRFGGRLPLVRTLVWRRLRRPAPGRFYSFLAVRD